jgi:hypothetical protein
MGIQGKKKTSRARLALLLVWSGFFVLDEALVVFYLCAGWIEMDNFTAALKQLSASYAPYLGVMLMFYWGKAKKSVTGSGSVKTGLPFGLALICSILWNSVISVLLLVLPVEAALANIKEIGALLAWLVAGATGYYFASDS